MICRHRKAVGWLPGVRLHLTQKGANLRFCAVCGPLTPRADNGRPLIIGSSRSVFFRSMLVHERCAERGSGGALCVAF
jgi:hypothetical protein